MRVISCVPSWTETLIEAGVEVIGRTRFCIHPSQKIGEIKIVGGTKDIHWDKVHDLKPDLLILDKEENPESFFKESPCESLVTHVKDLDSLSLGLKSLGERLENRQLREWSEWALQIKQQNLKKSAQQAIPFALDEAANNEFEEVLYLIWAKPFMSVSEQTYIGSVLQKLNLKNAVASSDSKYPQIDLSNFDPQKTLLLLSTEPFPFSKRREVIPQGWSSVLVDGEKFSWYGVRGLRALAEVLQ